MLSGGLLDLKNKEKYDVSFFLVDIFKSDYFAKIFSLLWRLFLEKKHKKLFFYS